MSYMEGQAYRLLMQHQLDEDYGKCSNEDCTWWVRDIESMKSEHAEHIAEEFALAGLFAESKKSVATIKAEALYEVADSICNCLQDRFDNDDIHFEDCPSAVLLRKADKLR